MKRTLRCGCLQQFVQPCLVKARLTLASKLRSAARQAAPDRLALRSQGRQQSWSMHRAASGMLHSPFAILQRKRSRRRARTQAVQRLCPQLCSFSADCVCWSLRAAMCLKLQLA